MPISIRRRRKNLSLTGTGGRSSPWQLISGTTVPLANVSATLTTAPPPTFLRLPFSMIWEAEKKPSEGVRPWVPRRGRPRRLGLVPVISDLPRITREQTQDRIVIPGKVVHAFGSGPALKLVGRRGEAPAPQRKSYDLDLDEFQF